MQARLVQQNNSPAMRLSRLNQKRQVKGKEPLEPSASFSERYFPRVNVIRYPQFEVIAIGCYMKRVAALVPPVDPIARKTIGGRFQNPCPLILSASYGFECLRVLFGLP